MEISDISYAGRAVDPHVPTPKESRHFQGHLQMFLDAQASALTEGEPISTGSSEAALLPVNIPKTPPVAISRAGAAAAYSKKEQGVPEKTPLRDIVKYMDDQLLSNPGGDHYYLEEQKVVASPEDQESFLGRLGKDISDAIANFKNFFDNFLFGATMAYRDKQNEIREVRQRGFMGSVVDFFKDAGSALSFGLWRPDGEGKPHGFGERLRFFFSKMKEALFWDLIQGIGSSVNHMGEDLLFTGWNLLESIPDATIGNFRAGKTLITRIFDGGQVTLDYLTDVVPFGEAWIRVHSLNFKKGKFPIFFNMSLHERHTEDPRWKYVRNTPFRKAIETIGSLLSDVLTIKLLGQSKWFSDDHHE
jgi:hypothetical protein